MLVQLYARIKTHNPLQVVNRRERCCAGRRQQCCAGRRQQCCAGPRQQCCAVPRQQCCAASRQQCCCQQGCSVMITMLLQHSSTINTVTTC